MAHILRVLGYAVGASLLLHSAPSLAAPDPIQPKTGTYNGTYNRALGDALETRAYANAKSSGMSDADARAAAKATVNEISAKAPSIMKAQERGYWSKMGNTAAETGATSGILCVGAAATGTAATLGIGAVSFAACPMFALGGALAGGIGFAVHNLFWGDPDVTINVSNDPAASGALSGPGVPKADTTNYPGATQAGFSVSTSGSQTLITALPGNSFGSLTINTSFVARGSATNTFYDVVPFSTEIGSDGRPTTILDGAVTIVGNLKETIDIDAMKTVSSCPSGHTCYTQVSTGPNSGSIPSGSRLWMSNRTYSTVGAVPIRRFSVLSQLAITMANMLQNPALQARLDDPVSSDMMADIANALYKLAKIADPKAVPYNANQPVTPQDVDAAISVGGYPRPTVRGMGQPMTPDGSTVPLGSGNPASTPVVTAPAGGSSPSQNTGGGTTTVKATVDLGNPSTDTLVAVNDTDLANPFSSFQSTLTAPFQSILSIGDAFNVTGQCPSIGTPAFTISGYSFAAITVTEHCTIFENLRTLIGSIMILGAIMVGIRALMEA